MTAHLSESFTLPPAKEGMGCADMFKIRDDCALNTLGIPYRRIDGGAYPPFFSKPEVERLKREWSSRSDDVFLVFPVEPVSDGFQAFSVALVEQCDVEAVDMDFPRWLDAAVSRRGWGYVEGLEKYTERRCLSTRSPPWQFPSKSFNFSCDPCRTSRGAVETEMPLIAVFVADPRFMVMKELDSARNLARKARGEQAGDIELIDLLDATVKNDRCDASGLSFLGNSLRSTAAWARAEAMYPDRIRIFFTEDFLIQPEVAMRGLARFLQVPDFTSATDNAVQQASRFADIHSCMCNLRPQKEYDAIRSASVEDRVLEFENCLGMLPQDLQAGWAQLVETWLTSPNSRMVTYALSVLNHDRWNPPSWWVAHNARVCRPCLYFPRGKCDSDNCGFCHGSGHAKPKRPSKGKRAARRRVDRTPSPDGSYRTPSPVDKALTNVFLQPPITGYLQAPFQTPLQVKSSEFVGDTSAQFRIDRTPSPQRFWARY
mmetsp:Transcript_29646/g.47752  ORF Transcript_29646/g.47752 Transcript_29646/m.47752 type:complete len:486 (+) Transcript_29646:44-1501(+)|eukprot:CAMPEP_0169067992 /NCGR_PEP_ID=MMETSP1015-20121227/3786_1 /TAXON_ID=342587 /ORGANISM="Karlodinium micrum, Strain CCMP2283" /LENGTH=485 /DNA_ID=CAMNT_0009126777 /DNA_START=44 /DNA_END=1501 /DNA_ORIENTATION=+